MTAHNPIPMSEKIDMTGARFGTWVVIGETQPFRGRAMWQAVCECGTATVLCGQDIRRGKMVDRFRCSQCAL